MPQYKLLIHHHDTAFVSETGVIMLTAGIAKWVNALAPYFKEIGLLLHHTKNQRKTNDTEITAINVRLISLGEPGNYVNYFEKRNRIKKACSNAHLHFDGLLIRGITPAQFLVWKKCIGLQKFFLLVRSPYQPRILQLSLTSFIAALANKIHEAQFRIIARSTTLIGANSPVYLPVIEKISGKPAYFIPTNTIQENDFSKGEYQPLSFPIKLLFVGRLSYLKGLRELIEALAILKVEHTTISLDIIGHFEQPALRDLQQLASQLNVSHVINWRGRIAFGSDLLNYYQSASFFILPSYTEGFPRVYWEAASQYCPVIITHVGGIPALLKHKETAMLIMPKNANAIADALIQLLADTELRKQIALNAYQLAQNYTVESCALKLVRTFFPQWQI